MVKKVTSHPIDQKSTGSTSYNIDQLSTNRAGFNLLLHWIFEMAAPIPPPRGGAGGVGGGAVSPPPPHTRASRTSRTGRTCRTPRSCTCWSHFVNPDGSCHASGSCWNTHPRPRRPSTPTTQSEITSSNL